MASLRSDLVTVFTNAALSLKGPVDMMRLRKVVKAIVMRKLLIVRNVEPNARVIARNNALLFFLLPLTMCVCSKAENDTVVIGERRLGGRGPHLPLQDIDALRRLHCEALRCEFRSCIGWRWSTRISN